MNQMLLNCRTKTFGITVTTETSSIRTSVHPEKMESRENRFLGEVLETEDPVVPSGPVDKNQRVTKPAHRDTVAECNVDMSNIKEERLLTINEPPQGAFGIVV